MNSEDWCELTENFRPQEHMEDVVKLLGRYRVFSTDDDRLYLFTNLSLDVQHAAYRMNARWICPCKDPSPCAAVTVMQVASFTWTVGPEPAEETHTPRRS